LSSTFTTHDPSTGRPHATWPLLSPAEVDNALHQATQAQSAWRTIDIAERANVLNRIADALRKDGAPIAREMTAEMGKPLGEALGEVKKSAWVCEHYAEHAGEMLAPRRVEAAAPDNHLRFDPLGVVLSVMPWNFPVWQVLRFAAPAWMAGNAVLMKHAPNTFGTAALLAQLCHEAGLPPGLLVDLRIDVDRVADVIADRRVAAVTLTGSDRAGRAVAAEAGRHLKKCVLELGGSDAFIVLADANIEAAVAAGVASRTLNSGQSCIAAKRFFVEDSVYNAFVDKFCTAMADLELGAPTDASTQVGPLARLDLRDQLHAQVSASVAAGALLKMGGSPVPGPGCFYPPTVLTDIPDGCPADTEELFGPVASIWRVQDAAEAITRANRSRFGLSSSLWTADRDRAARLAQHIEAGGVFVNQFSYSDPRLPFGGIKDSGYGRELGLFGILEFVNIKTVSIR